MLFDVICSIGNLPDELDEPHKKPVPVSVHLRSSKDCESKVPCYSCTDYGVSPVPHSNLLHPCDMTHFQSKAVQCSAAALEIRCQLTHLSSHMQKHTYYLQMNSRA